MALERSAFRDARWQNALQHMRDTAAWHDEAAVQQLIRTGAKTFGSQVSCPPGVESPVTVSSSAALRFRRPMWQAPAADKTASDAFSTRRRPS